VYGTTPVRLSTIAAGPPLSRALASGPPAARLAAHMRRDVTDPGFLLLLVPVVAAAVVMGVLLAAAPEAASAAATVQWGWPVARPSVARPFSAPASKYGPGHRGIDLRAPVGSAVLAPVSGVVIFAGRLAGRPLVSIRRAGWRAELEPVDPSVKVGDVVIRGDVIGHLAAGHCVVGCLHWGVRNAQRTYVNPLTLVQGRVRLLPVYGAVSIGL